MSAGRFATFACALLLLAVAAEASAASIFTIDMANSRFLPETLTITAGRYGHLDEP